MLKNLTTVLLVAAPLITAVPAAHAEDAVLTHCDDGVMFEESETGGTVATGTDCRLGVLGQDLPGAATTSASATRTSTS